MILGIPVIDGHALTNNLLESLQATVADQANFEVVIIDNASAEPYEWSQYRRFPFPVHIIRYEENKGYYLPLQDLYERWLAGEYNARHETIGLIHNDMVLYSSGWDVYMEQAFMVNEKLALVGLCGSNEIDELGGRGNGTMVNFMGRDMVSFGDQQYKGQDPSAGRRLPIGQLQPALCLDSLFMIFRASAIPFLQPKNEWQNITLAHFYDRIWPVRLVEQGYRVGVMGFDCDHIGGMTATGNERYRDDCIKWLNARQIPFENPETEMYLVAERLYLGEYRNKNHFLPAKIDSQWKVEHYART